MGGSQLPPTDGVSPRPQHGHNLAGAAAARTSTHRRGTAFRSIRQRVTAATIPYTWRPGCPVGPAALRMLHLIYWGFDEKAHTGKIVVNEVVVADVVTVFRLFYEERFPIREMVPEDAYHGNDNAAAAADDTSGFNCRYAVASRAAPVVCPRLRRGHRCQRRPEPVRRRRHHNPAGGRCLPRPGQRPSGHGGARR